MTTAKRRLLQGHVGAGPGFLLKFSFCLKIQRWRILQISLLLQRSSLFYFFCQPSPLPWITASLPLNLIVYSSSGALMRIECIALKTLRQLICGFDFTQLLGEISDVSSPSTVSHKIRLSHPEMLIPCCSISEGCGCYQRNRAVMSFMRRCPMRLGEGITMAI